MKSVEARPLSSETKSQISIKQMDSRERSATKTYAPPHVKTSSKAFSSDEEDVPVTPSIPPQITAKKPSRKQQQHHSRKDSNRNQTKNGKEATESRRSGTPGVDRPPEKVEFSKRRDETNGVDRNRKVHTTLSGHRGDDETNDSVTIDSYLQEKSRRHRDKRKDHKSRKSTVNARGFDVVRGKPSNQSSGLGTFSGETTEDGNGTHGSASVYHLAHEDLRTPSPEHRKNLNEWYRRQSRSTEDMEKARRSSGRSSRHRYQRQQVNPPRPDRRRSRGGGIISSMFGSSHETTDDDHSEEAGGVFRAESTEYSPHAVVGSNSFFNEAGSADDDYLRTKQETAFMSISLTAIQLLVLCLQLAMCGIAGLDINPFVGPYPDAFSEWGGKNAYLMIEENQWFRLVSPAFLHVGILHLLANAFCQLEPIALFEREWGSGRWLVLYLISAVGCMSLSSVVDADTIAVGSSGSLMGLFSAKLAQVMSHTMFEVNKSNQDELIRLDQLSSVICGLTLVSLLSFFTYIDWSGHMGGLIAGFFGGMLLFCNPIQHCCSKFIWGLLGLCGLVGSFGFVFYYIFYLAEPADQDLANACEYFRYFFPEDYECGCMVWK